MPGLVEAVGIGLGAFVVPAIVGGLLHELTHAAVVVALGHDLKGMNLHRALVGISQGSTVVYETYYTAWWNALIGTAPLIVGGVAAGAWWLSGWPLVGPWGTALAVGWAFYTLNVSREDALHGRVPEKPHVDKAVHFAFIAGVGVVLQVPAYGPASGIGFILMVAGVVGLGLNLGLAEAAEEVEGAGG